MRFIKNLIMNTFLQKKIINKLCSYTSCLLLAFLFFPKVYAANFTVTGYYSPLPNQEFYLTGNYESEKRLNGHGIMAADGTEVYHGMIAGPKNYAFGTNICLEKLGCGTVHDRGGAIVNKGVRRKAVNDRLDFWMGYGTDGLVRSLLWGVRNVGGRFVKIPRKNRMNPSEILPAIALEIIREKKQKILFTKNIYPGASNTSVQRVKESLAFLNIFTGDVDANFDESLKKSVIDFQVTYKVIETASSAGAGNFGPKTREKLEDVLRSEIFARLRSEWKTQVFEKNLGYEDHDMDIYRLQQILLDQGFFSATPTGYFGDKTKSALQSFQLSHGLIKTKKSVGSGNFGPKTRKKMTEIWLAKRDAYFPETEELKIILEDDPTMKSLAVEKKRDLVFLGKKETVTQKDLFDDSVILFRGKRNENVRKLQRELKRLGFFTGNETGFYGDETAEAVLSFQYKYFIIMNRRNIGASVFGPATRAKLNELL